MAKLSAHGTEIARYFDPRHRALMAVMEDGTTLGKHPYSKGWKPFSRKKPDVSLEDWRAMKAAKIAALPAWARECDSIPSIETLSEWISDGTCETVSGDPVEPDGCGPDGAPSWLRALGMI